MNKRIEEELFPFYALDALSDEEKAEVEAYIASNPAARARLDALQETAAFLPLSSEPVQPSSSVKTNLMARVQADPRARNVQAGTPLAQKRLAERPSAGKPPWWERFRQTVALPALAGTAVLAALFLFIWAISLSQQVNQLQEQMAVLTNNTEQLTEQLALLQADNDQLRVRNETLQQQLQSQEDLLASYQAPGTTTIAIGDNTGENPEARATLTVAPESASATFVAENLQPLTPDQDYQLWIIQGDQAVSAGIFQVDENGRAIVEVAGALAASFDAVGVSVEPAGGSEQPTPDQIILLGTASS